MKSGLDSSYKQSVRDIEDLQSSNDPSYSQPDASKIDTSKVDTSKVESPIKEEPVESSPEKSPGEESSKMQANIKDVSDLKESYEEDFGQSGV